MVRKTEIGGKELNHTEATCDWGEDTVGCSTVAFELDFVTTTVSGLVNQSIGVNSSIEEVPGLFFQSEQLAFLWLLLTVIVLGNSLVLASLLHSRARKSRMNFFIAHLAAADLSVGLLSVLVDIGWKLTISWEAGLTACRVIKFCQLLVTYGSTYVLVALSIDRYDAITHPMNFTGSWKRARWLVLFAWLTAAAFSFPILFFFTVKDTGQYGTQCWIEFPEQWHWKLYMTLVALSLFFLPTMIIASCYAVIVATVWHKGRAMAPPTCTPALLPRYSFQLTQSQSTFPKGSLNGSPYATHGPRGPRGPAC